MFFLIYTKLMNAKELKKLDPVLIDALKQDVFNKIVLVKKILEEKLKFTIPDIPVFFNQRGNRAGVYFCAKLNKADRGLRFNLKFLLENREDFIKNIVPHEYCHYVTHLIVSAHPNPEVLKNFKAHGKEWKAMMRSLGLEPKTSHNYKVPPKKFYNYQCLCDDGVLVGPMVYKKISLTKTSQRKKYVCKKCRTILGPEVPSKIIYL